MSQIKKTLRVVIVALLTCAVGLAADRRQIPIDTREGTWMSLDVSPDGTQIVFDLLGDIYILPVSGGEARRLTSLPKPVPDRNEDALRAKGLIADEASRGQAFDCQPRFSPDGKYIAFISDRDGADNLWLMNADGSGVRKLSTGEDQLSSPAWSPDGESVAARHVSLGPRGGGAGEIYLYRVEASTGGSRLTDGAKGNDADEPAFSPDGQTLYFSGHSETVVGRGLDFQIRRLDRRTGMSIEITNSFAGAVRALVSPDGKWLSYVTWDDDQAELRIRNLATGAERVVKRGIEGPSYKGRMGLLPSYAFSPDGQYVYLSYGGGFHRVDVAGGATQEVPFHVQTTIEVGSANFLKVTPSQGEIPVRMLDWTQFSSDRRIAVFDAIGKIWAVAGEGGAPHRLTTRAEREYAPSISPDDKWVAYVTWSDFSGGNVFKVPIAGGEPVQLTREPAYYANPTWSADGKRILVMMGGGAQLRGQSPIYDYERYLGWLPAAGGEFHRVMTLEYYHPYRGGHFDDVSGHFTLDGLRIWFMVNQPAGSQVGLYGMESCELHSISQDGSDERTHLKLSGAGYLTPCLIRVSPDERHVVFISGNEEVWLMPMPWSPGAPLTVDVSAKPLPGLFRVSEVGGYFPDWIDDYELSWTFAGKLFRRGVRINDKPVVVEVDLKASVPAPKGIIAFRGARLITMNGDEVVENGTIVVHDNRIVAVGPSASVRIPAGAKTIEARGKTIIPGIFDIHDHVLPQETLRNLPEQWPQFADNLAYGVTTIRDPSIPNLSAFYLSELVNSGQMVGPRTYLTGEPLVPPLVYVNTLQDALHAVELNKDLGADMIKEYLQQTRRQRQLVGEATRTLHIMTTAEGGIDFKNNLGMLIDGYPGTEHLWAYHQMYSDVGQLMAKTGYFYTPTLGTSAAGSQYWYRRMEVDRDPKQRRFTRHRDEEDLLRRVLGPNEKIAPEWGPVFRASIESVNRMDKAGAKVAVGSHDIPTPTGLGTHWEMWSYVEGGMSPLEALHCGTINSAQAIGMGYDLGSLEAGKLADLVILNTNPLDKIQNSADIFEVMRNGFLYDGNTLDEVWPKPHKFPPLWPPEQ